MISVVFCLRLRFQQFFPWWKDIWRKTETLRSAAHTWRILFSVVKISEKGWDFNFSLHLLSFKFPAPPSLSPSASEYLYIMQRTHLLNSHQMSNEYSFIHLISIVLWSTVANIHSLFCCSESVYSWSLFRWDRQNTHFPRPTISAVWALTLILALIQYLFVDSCMQIGGNSERKKRQKSNKNVPILDILLMLLD